MTCNQIGKPPDVLKDRHRDKRLGRDFSAEFDPFLKLMHHTANQRLQLQRVRPMIFVHVDVDLGILFKIPIAHDERAVRSFDQNAEIAVGQLHNLLDLRNRPDVVNCFARRIFLIELLLRNQKYFLILDHRRFDRAYRAPASHIEVNNHIREYSHAAQRHNGQVYRLSHIITSPLKIKPCRQPARHFINH